MAYMTMSDRRTIILSAMMVTVGPISMALITPAMPQMAEEFGTTDGVIARTLTFFLVGFAFGQLVVGPVADRYGRRPIALLFAAIYVAASVAALLAPSLDMLLFARLIQGIGVSSGLVISRAMVRDAYEGQTAARIFSTIAICNAIVPMLSPSLGAISAQYLGWHWLFGLMAFIGGTLLLALVVFQKETLAAENRSVALEFGRMARTYGELLSNRRFLAPAATMGTAIGAIYIISILMPFILIGQIGLSNALFGAIMGLQTLSYIVSAFLYNRLQRHLKDGHALRVSAGLFMIALALLIMLIWTAPLSPASYIIPVMVWVSGNAFAIPNLTTAALQQFPDRAGAASALLGFIQILFASLGTFFVGLLPIDPGQKMLVVFIVSAVRSGNQGEIQRQSG